MFAMNTSQGEYDLINSFNNLLEKFTIVRHKYINCLKDFQDLEHVNKYLVTKLSESHALIDSLKSKNLVLGSKVDLLENKLKESETRLEKFSSNSLENIMHTKNFDCDESELSCDCNATLSSLFLGFLQLNKLKVSLFLHATIVGLLVTLDQTVGNSKLLLRKKIK